MKKCLCLFQAKKNIRKSSELVLDFVEKANVQITTRQYLNISPITELENFNNVVGIFFLATPDMLSGLASWTFYDNNSDDAITAKFGSGCSSIFRSNIGKQQKWETYIYWTV